MASRLEDTTTDEEAFNDYCKDKGGGQRGELQIELSDLDVQVDSDDDLDRFLGVNKSKKAKSAGESGCRTFCLYSFIILILEDYALSNARTLKAVAKARKVLDTFPPSTQNDVTVAEYGY